MLRKSLLLTLCLCLLAAPMALAAGDDRRTPTGPSTSYQSYDHRMTAVPGGSSADYQADGMCFTGPNGQGEAIDWAKSKLQCSTQTNGHSWASSGNIENIYGDRGR